MPAHYQRRRPLFRLIMAAAAIGLFMVGYYWGNQYKRGDSAPLAVEAVLVRPPIELPAVELRDASGQPFTTENFADRWTLLSLGELSQASGHLAITRMIEVRNRLAGDSGLQEMLQLALASERQDTSLALDFTLLSPSLEILSGEPGELQRLRASLGATGEDASETAADEAPLYLIGPAGRLVALFTDSQAPADIASDLSAIAEHSDSLYAADD